jgi:hypothetical protein
MSRFIDVHTVCLYLSATLKKPTDCGSVFRLVCHSFLDLYIILSLFISLEFPVPGEQLRR